jgi:trimethylamine--corrinoid protein Co-methyltransferase
MFQETSMSNPSEETIDTPQPTMRRGRKSRTKLRAGLPDQNSLPVRPGMEGGRYGPLAEADLARIDGAILEVLGSVGMSEAPPLAIKLVTDRGGKVSCDGRLTFPRSLVEEALAGLTRDFTLHGQAPGHEMVLSGNRVHVGSGGAAPTILDLETGRYRCSTLRDLYDAARIVDTLENIHFFSRSLVARDMPDALSLDVNTAYASLSGTVKHVCTSVSVPENVAPIAEMCFAIAGSREAFVEQPFLSININHVTPPLRFATEACDVLAEAAHLGIPVHVNTFGQLGASSPVTIAGSLVQTVAETLAGMMFAWLVNPNVKAVFGARPMITDLRTGAMSGGGGEQAVLMAAATQMAQFYGLPNSSIAGATDSKIADAQSGYEKSLSVTLAAHAGSNMITQACGMHASLMGCAFESYVIDNDMLGGILRSIGAVEVSEATLAIGMIGEVVRGEGHYLGQAETLGRMETDFLYPRIADRRSPGEWEADGSRDIREMARARAREILATHFPVHIDEVADQKLRESHDIRLRREVMSI